MMKTTQFETIEFHRMICASRRMGERLVQPLSPGILWKDQRFPSRFWWRDWDYRSRSISGQSRWMGGTSSSSSANLLGLYGCRYHHCWSSQLTDCRDFVPDHISQCGDQCHERHAQHKTGTSTGHDHCKFGCCHGYGWSVDWLKNDCRLLVSLLVAWVALAENELLQPNAQFVSNPR